MLGSVGYSNGLNDLDILIERERRRRQREVATLPPVWAPQDGPQRAAYESAADIVGYGGAAGGGKALGLDTPIPTPSGWTTMGDLQPEDLVFDERGQPCTVLAVSDVMYGHQVYEVCFDDGSTIIADADHRWLTMTDAERSAAHRRTAEFREQRRKERPTRWTGKRPDLVLRNSQTVYDVLAPPIGAVRTTREIFHSTFVRNGKRVNHSVVVAQPIDLPDARLPIPPYVLGAWLGDGNTRNAGYTCADDEILDAIRACGYTVSKRNQVYAYGILGLQSQLRMAGLLGDKHIPAIYLRASEDQRWALLAGLMDTDGTALPSGSCEFYSTSRRLAYGVWELLISLGIKCSIVVGRAKLNGHDCGEKYRIKFTTSRPVFRLKRKQERQVTVERGVQQRRFIVNVRPVPSEPVKCITVNSPSHLYLAGWTMVPTHNSDLLLGFAGTQHRRSVIFRRVFPSLRGLIERSREVFNAKGDAHSRDSYNEQLHVWRLADGRMIEFGAVQYDQDKRKHQGQARDFIGFDEATEFPEAVVRFLMAWNRTTWPGQRCRVVMTFNPPMDEAGAWVLRFFGPWLDPQHPNPAEDGELRWYAMVDGQEVARPDGEPFAHDGQIIQPKSRTFFHANLDDNPALAETGYGATIDALPEPLRSLLKGNFAAARGADPWQVIPAGWVRQAQARWREREQPDVPLQSLGVDPARGGQDRMAIAKLYGNWCAEIETFPGVMVPDGPSGAALIVNALDGESGVTVGIDVIGIGSSIYDSAVAMDIDAIAVNNSESAGDARDRSEKFRFRNVRAASYWKLREALDPVHGDELALPDDPELLADLCAPRFKVPAAGIQIESKDDIKARIGRSPDKGDALVIAHWVLGQSGWLLWGDG